MRVLNSFWHFTWHGPLRVPASNASRTAQGLEHATCPAFFIFFQARCFIYYHDTCQNHASWTSVSMGDLLQPGRSCGRRVCLPSLLIPALLSLVSTLLAPAAALFALAALSTCGLLLLGVPGVPPSPAAPSAGGSARSWAWQHAKPNRSCPNQQSNAVPDEPAQIGQNIFLVEVNRAKNEKC